MDPALQALDHHSTVQALAAALPETTYATDDRRDQIARQLTTNLTQAGLALTTLPEQPGAAWFRQEGEQP